MSQAASAPVANTASPAQQATDGGQISTTATTGTEYEGASVSREPREADTPRELGSTESIVDALADMDGESSGQERDTTAPGTEAGPDASDPLTQGGDTPPAQEQPAVGAPATWTPEEKALFGQLPPALQQAVARRETERERFVHAKTQETAQTRHNLDLFSQWISQNLDRSLQTAQMLMEGDYASIDWQRLKQSDPTTHAKLEERYRARYAKLARAAAENRQMAELGQLQARQIEGQRLEGEFDAAMPQVVAMVGANVSKTAVSDTVAAYLRHLGAPPEHVGGVTHAYQLTMAVKAMLWDQATHARARAAQKVAAAPRVQKTSGRGTDSTGRDPGRARDALRRRGSSTDNVADALKHLGF